MRRISISLLALGFSIGACETGPGPSEPMKDPAVSARRAGIDLYKQGRFEEALQAFDRARREAPQDAEICRLIGSTQARMGNRAAAYRSYREYVERCPQCVYAPSVRNILQDYEAMHPEPSEPPRAAPTDPAPATPVRLLAPEPPSLDPHGADRSVSSADEKLARKLYEEAYVIKSSDPQRSLERLEQVLRLVSEDHVYYSKASRLRTRILAGQ